MCNCEFCIRSRRWNEIVERKNTEELLELIREIRDLLCNVEEDLSIKNCILSGDWPSADKYAERMMEGFRKMKEREAEEEKKRYPYKESF